MKHLLKQKEIEHTYLHPTSQVVRPLGAFAPASDLAGTRPGREGGW